MFIKFCDKRLGWSVCSAGQERPVIRLENYGDPVFKVLGWAATGIPEPEWPKIFAVYVDSDLPKNSSGSLPIFGSYKIEKGVLTFKPRFPLQPGLRYRTILNVKVSQPVSATFLIPKSESDFETAVEHIYPSTDRLPENQLKFYIHFSSPMSRGEAYRHISLLDGTGRQVELPFLELDEELWDRDYKRLTILFDPGRVKRGLVPHEELGTALIQGRNYVLAIDRGWLDASGKPLKQTVRKRFHVGPADRESPDPKRWRLNSPKGGTKEFLTVDFPKPMDRALLERLLEVIEAAGNSVPGVVQIDREETRWRFKPREDWRAGNYFLRVGTTLEDLAGNRIGRLFDVDTFERVEKEITRKTVSLSFKIVP